MRYTIQLFAIARERVGKSAVEVELPPAATIAILRQQLAQQFPVLADILPAVRFAVNADYARDQTELPPHAEVAVIPPVSGG
jgi:molybdopterin synthase catalytic subunit